MVVGGGLSKRVEAQPTLIDRATKLYVSGDLRGAKLAAQQIAEREPANPLAFAILGTIAVREEDFQTAEKHLLRAISLEPNLIGTRLTLGQVYFWQGNNELAARTYRKALELDSTNIKAYSALATVEQARGRLSEAERVLEKLRGLDPNNSDSLLKSARIANLQGASEKALALLLEAKKTNPQDFRVLYAFGVMCLQMDLIEDGTRALEQAVEILPGDYSASYALATARVARKDYATAMEIYERLRRNHPENAQLHYALGVVSFYSGKLDEAERQFVRSMDILPAQVESLYYLAQIAQQRANPDKAIDLLSRVLESQPTHSRARLALGLIYRKLRKLQPARQELEEAVRLDPSLHTAQYQLGLLLAQLGERQEAKRHLGIASTLREQQEGNVSWKLLLPNETAGQVTPQARSQNTSHASRNQ